MTRIFILFFLLFPTSSHSQEYEQESEEYELIVYDYHQELPYQIKTYGPCHSTCNNETRSQGYAERDPQTYWTEQETQAAEQRAFIKQVLYNTLPFVQDPIMRNLIQDQIK